MRRKSILDGLKKDQPHETTYPEYIAGQMEAARTAASPEERASCLANAVAANGLWLRALEIDFVPPKLPLDVIGHSSSEIQKTRAFREFMADGSGERLADTGSIDAVVEALKNKAEALEQSEPDAPAINTIHEIQVKVQSRTSSPRDFARLVAVHRLCARHEEARQTDGAPKKAAERELTRRISASALREETDRVLRDEDFQYLMKHEHSENLRINALRANGAGFERFRARVSRMREQEAAEKAAEANEKAAPDTLSR